MKRYALILSVISLLNAEGGKHRPWPVEDKFVYRDAQTHILIYQQQIDKLVSMQRDWRDKMKEMETKNSIKGFTLNPETLEEIEDAAPVKAK